MKKRTLTVICVFLFFSLTLASCDQKKIVNEVKNEKSSTIPDSDVDSKSDDIDEASSDSLEASSESEIEAKLEEITPEDLQEVSYAFGHLLVQQLRTMTDNIRFDIAYIIQGMEAAEKGVESPLSEEEYEGKLRRLHDINMKHISAHNLMEAEMFLKNNISVSDVVVLVEDKLQYKIVQSGEGEEVSLSSAPCIYFKGYLLNGKMFGSSEKSPEPVKIVLAQTIPGVAQGMVGMKAGEKRILYIHPDLGYGSAENMPILPNSLLIFEVEVVSVSETEELTKGEQVAPESNMSLDQEMS